jgi:L-amino acid N-acyltransferase
LERHRRGFPVLAAKEDGRLLGFASFGDFRAWEGYAATVEHSIYVDAPARRRGIGRALLSGLIDRARALELHAMVGGIEAENRASLNLHAALGFTEVGRLTQVGRKFGRWLDLVFVERLLDEQKAG